MAACASGARIASAVTSWVKGCLATATASTLTSAVGVSSFALQPVNRVLAITRAVAILVEVFRITRIRSYGSFRRITEVYLRQLSCQGLQLSKGNVISDCGVDLGGLRCAVGVLRIDNFKNSGLAGGVAHVGEAQALGGGTNGFIEGGDLLGGDGRFVVELFKGGDQLPLGCGKFDVCEIVADGALLYSRVRGEPVPDGDVEGHDCGVAEVAGAISALQRELWRVDSIEVRQGEIRQVGGPGGIELELCGASRLQCGTEIGVVLCSVGLHLGFGGQNGGLVQVVGQRVGREGIGEEKNREIEARFFGGE